MTQPLAVQVEDFAAEVTRTVQAVLGDTEVDLTATLLEPRFTVSTTAPTGIELRVDGKPFLRMKVLFECGWDTPGHHMAVNRSEFHVFLCVEREVLFRYEFLRETSLGIPTAHLQIHGHRDALTYAMTRLGTRSRRARRRGRSEAVPTMSQLHFPLGGSRFRPPLEDVLHMLVEEFGVDAADEWRQHLEQGRETWRRIQTRVAVRDAPEEAAEVLRALHYRVEPPEDGPAQDDLKRLRTI